VEKTQLFGLLVQCATGRQANDADLTNYPTISAKWSQMVQ